MKKIIVGLFLVFAIAGVFYLVQTGVITWQPLTMIVAALAAPFKFIMGLFGSEEKIRAKFQAERDAEHEWQQNLEKRITEREESEAKVLKEIEEIDVKLKKLEDEQSQIESKIADASPEDIQKKTRERFGN